MALGFSVGLGVPLGFSVGDAEGSMLGAAEAVGTAVGKGEVTGIGSGAIATGTLRLGAGAPPVMAATPPLFS